MATRNYTISFQIVGDNQLKRIVVSARNEKKARNECKQQYGNDINILSVAEKRDSSLLEDDDWA